MDNAPADGSSLPPGRTPWMDIDLQLTIDRPPSHHAQVQRLLVSLLLLAAGCGTASLTLTPAPAVDRTVPSRVERRFSSVMVLPPSGSERGQGSEYAVVERFLLAGGIKVISSGITGRIVEDGSGNRVETGANLSDLERALVLARKSNADALLQVLDVGFVRGHRWFTADPDGVFHEVAPGHDVQLSNSVKVLESLFHFQARPISADAGEIVMSVEITQSTSRTHTPADPKTFSWQTTPSGLTGSAREIDTDSPEHRREVIEEVMSIFLSRLTGSEPSSKK